PAAPGPSGLLVRLRLGLRLSFALRLATGLAVLLDLGLRQILVLAAHHPEDGRRTIRAARNRTELDRRLLARPSRRTTRSAPHLGDGRRPPPPAAGRRTRSATSDRCQDRLAGAADRFLLHRDAELIDEPGNDVCNGTSGLSRHWTGPPLLVVAETNAGQETFQWSEIEFY